MLFRPMLHNQANLFVGDKNPLHADGLWRVRRLEQHISATNEILCARSIKNGPRINLAGH